MVQTEETLVRSATARAKYTSKEQRMLIGMSALWWCGDTDQKATCDTCKGSGVVPKGIKHRPQAFKGQESLIHGDKHPRSRFFMEEAIKESLQSQNEDRRMHPFVGVIFEKDDKIIPVVLGPGLKL